MSCDVTDTENVALYDTVTGHAFGPTFPSTEHAEDFLAWMREVPLGELVERLHLKPPERLFGVDSWHDPRVWDVNVLESLQVEWREARCDEDGDLLPQPEEVA